MPPVISTQAVCLVVGKLRGAVNSSWPTVLRAIKLRANELKATVLRASALRATRDLSR